MSYWYNTDIFFGIWVSVVDSKNSNNANILMTIDIENANLSNLNFVVGYIEITDPTIIGLLDHGLYKDCWELVEELIIKDLKSIII